ncbi:MAG: hypothetical protein GXZ10_12230 [Gammaproteobacteria bacterium]|nr:hypothetical protein [Gammaproteobacteria bacterium]
MKPTPKPPLFSRRYKVFALIVVLAIITAISLPKVRQWLASDMHLTPTHSLS